MLLQWLSFFDETKGFSDEVEKSAFYCFPWLIYCVGYVLFLVCSVIVNAIYLYDGYFTMILNAGNRPLSIENIPLDDIEKTFENDDVGCSSNSQLVADAPPMKKPRH